MNMSKTIIVADNNEANLAIEKSVLDSYYDVFAVPTGRTLFLLLKSIKPDLILLDVNIDNMNSNQIIGALKESKKTKYVPIILTGCAINIHEVEKLIMTGTVSYLPRPFTPEELTDRVEMCLW